MSSSARLADELAFHLRNRLVSGEFAANESLSESGIAAEYGVARPTARAAIDALTSDGLLIREPHLPPRIPQVASEDMHEIIGILEVSERMALDRVLSLPAGKRAVSLPTDGQTANLLNALTLASGSERLAWIHRRTTFEFLLAVQQHNVDSDPVGLSTEHQARRSLVEAISSGRSYQAAEALHALQQARRAPVDAFLTVKLGRTVPRLI